MRFFGRAAGCVSHHVDLVVAFQHRAQGKGVVTYFGPQTRHNHFFLAVSFQGITHFLVIPGVHGGTFQDVLARENVQQFREGVTREALGLNGGQYRWDVENFRCFSQGNNVVFQNLTVN